jgi:hypothetical protein
LSFIKEEEQDGRKTGSKKNRTHKKKPSIKKKIFI